MSGLFLSYAHADLEQAIHLEEALRSAGYHVFRDRDEHHGLPAGSLWARELFRALDRVDVVVFLASEASLVSPWCHTELSVAVAHGKHVVQVSTSDVGVHPVLSERQAMQPTLALEDLAERLLSALDAAGFPPSPVAGWDPGRSPYPGLGRLTVEYAPVLFGRDTEISAILERLSQPEPPPVLVVGASGSGKSSLLQAGVLARLQRRANTVVLPVVYPGGNPVGRLALALRHAEPTLDLGSLIDDPDGIEQAVDELTAGGQRVVACIDQAEDLLTVPDPESTRQLLTRLNAIDPARLSLVVALRSASMDAWGQDPRFAALSPTDPVWVRPLDRAGLREVIVGPAREAGISIEPPELVEEILDDTGDGRALPLLAGLLEEMAEGHSRMSPVVFDPRRYRAIGPVARIIERRAEATSRELHASQGLTEREVAEAYLRLADVDQDEQVISTELEVDLLPKDVREVFDAFERNRLVVKDLRGTAAAGQSTLEPAEVVVPIHEVVFRAWPTLAELVRTQKQDIELRGRLRREAQQWMVTGEGVVGLTGGRLERALEWRERYPEDLSPEVDRFLDAAHHQRQRRRALTFAAPALAAVALVVAIVAVALSHQVGLASQARRTTEGVRLAGDAQSVGGTRHDLSMLLALEAAQRGGDSRAVQAPFVALTRGPGPRNYARLGGPAKAGSFDASGTHLVALFEGGTTDWDGTARHAVRRTDGTVVAVAVSADGSTVAQAEARSWTVRPWGSDAGATRCPVRGGDAELLRLTRTGGVVVMVVADRGRTTTSTILVGPAHSCTPTYRHRVAGIVSDLVLDEDTDRLAFTVLHNRSAGDPTREAGVQLLTLSSGHAFPTLARSAGDMDNVALTRDEVAAFADDGTLRVWQTGTAQPWESHVSAHSGRFLQPLPRLAQDSSPSNSRWLAADAAGALIVVTTHDDASVQAFTDIPPLGSGADAAPVALSTRPGTAILLDATGRIATWSFDTATAFDSGLLAQHRINHVAALSGGAVVATGPLGAWFVDAKLRVTSLPDKVSNAILVARGRTWAMATPAGSVLIGHVSSSVASPALQEIGQLATAPVAIALMDRSGSSAVAAVEANGRVTVLGDGVPRTLQTGGPGNDQFQVRGAAGEGNWLYLVWSSGRLAVVDLSADASGDRAHSNNRVRFYPAHDDATAVALSPNGRLLATGGDDRKILLWDIRNGVPRARSTLVGHNDKVVGLAFSPDGRELSSSGEDSAVIRWNAALGERVGEPVTVPSPDPFAAIAYAPDGAAELIVGAVGVSRWPLSPDRWVALTCRILGGRTLTDDERQQFLSGAAPLARCPGTRQ